MKMRTVAFISVITVVCVAIILAVVFTTVTGAPASEPQEQVITKAVVFFNAFGTEERNIAGNLTLEQSDPTGPVKITGKITGLKPEGEHGFHVHESGDISGGCGTTRGHFNPNKVVHGAPGDSVRHVGDLGNIPVSAAGVAEISITDTIISLNGPNSVIGRAMVVHAGTDDLGKGTGEKEGDSKKTGNAGGRLTCGIIAIA